MVSSSVMNSTGNGAVMLSSPIISNVVGDNDDDVGLVCDGVGSGASLPLSMTSKPAIAAAAASSSSSMAVVAVVGGGGGFVAITLSRSSLPDVAADLSEAV